MKTKISSLYKHLAILSFLTFFYPALTVLGCIFNIKQTTVIPQFWLVLLIGFIGFAVDEINFSRKIYEKLAITFTAIVTITALVFIDLKMPWYQILLFSATAFASYIFGVHFAKNEYMNILTESNFLRISIVYVVATLYLWIANYKYNPVLLIAFYLFSAVLYIVIKNQSHIENLMLRRNYSKDYLPEKIRSYNLVLLGVVFVGLIIFFLCFSGVFQNLVSPVETVLRKLAQAIKSSGTGKDLLPDDINIGTDFDIDMDQYGETPKGSSLVPNIIFSILAIIVFALFIYFFKDKILELLQNLISKLNNALKRLFGNSKRKKSKDSNEAEVEEYIDIDQSISALDNDVEKELPEKTRRRNWKKAYKNYLKTEISSKKYEEGYLLAVEGLKINGINLKDSYTTLEIADASKDYLSDADRLSSTIVYNELLYGEKSFNKDDMRLMDSLLIRIQELFKEKPNLDNNSINEIKKEPDAASKQKAIQQRLNDQYIGETNRDENIKKSKRLVGVGKLLIFGVIGIFLIVFLLNLFTRLVLG